MACAEEAARRQLGQHAGGRWRAVGVLARCGRGTTDLSTKLGLSLALALAFGVSAGTNRSRRGETDRSALPLFGLGNEYAYYARVWRHASR